MSVVVFSFDVFEILFLPFDWGLFVPLKFSVFVILLLSISSKVMNEYDDKLATCVISYLLIN